ncbi:MAG TPA: PfkB family carbohydrate kinase [Candidatus Polarisedimenticolaceae bacterium]|nr:PfkB family carbohydrate kinase [Candidatus Polarisedimenticolaceae bacterium]
MTKDDAARLLAVVRGFRGLRVAVLADLVCDEFVHGDIARISREAPVLILEHTKTETVAGGGGNAAANLRALGAVPLPVGVVGRDEAGAGLLRLFRRLGIATSGIAVVRGYRTPTKSRVLAGGVHTRRQQIVRIDRGEKPGDLPRGVASRVASALRRQLARADGLLVADYGYGAAVPSLVEATRRSWREKVVTVDSRHRILDYRGVTAITPNQEEVERALGLPGIPSAAALASAGARLLARTGDTHVLVTRGAAGMVLFDKRAKPLAIPAFGSGEVADVTGAGDTVVATFTLALLAGAAPADAATLANVTAGLAVMKYGTATIRPPEIAAALRR